MEQLSILWPDGYVNCKYDVSEATLAVKWVPVPNARQ